MDEDDDPPPRTGGGGVPTISSRPESLEDTEIRLRFDDGGEGCNSEGDFKVG